MSFYTTFDLVAWLARTIGFVTTYAVTIFSIFLQRSGYVSIFLQQSKLCENNNFCWNSSETRIFSKLHMFLLEVLIAFLNIIFWEGKWNHVSNMLITSVEHDVGLKVFGQLKLLSEKLRFLPQNTDISYSYCFSSTISFLLSTSGLSWNKLKSSQAADTIIFLLVEIIREIYLRVFIGQNFMKSKNLFVFQGTSTSNLLAVTLEILTKVSLEQRWTIIILETE